MNPELSGEETATRERVLAALPARTLPGVNVADTGVLVRIGPPGPCVGLRGEMDALPIDEATGAPWASQRPGVMHACGHDVHLAATVAVARTLDRLDVEVPALVVLQPREETYPSGAAEIATSKSFIDEQCAVMIGAHLQPSLGSGVIACIPGGVNASSDEFRITVTGSSGHAAYPHLATDPILALSQILVALPSIVGRLINPMIPGLVGVSSLSSGRAANIIPETALATNLWMCICYCWHVCS